MRNRALFASAALALAQAAPFPAAAQSDIPELDPLYVTAPRLKMAQPEMIDPAINANLLRLLRYRADARPDSQAQQDASVGNLVRLTTVTGYKLKTRYTELGFLLTEGLAGVKDLALAGELERVARQGTNVQTRASAMVALAYTKDNRYLPTFQSALLDSNITVRFGALEALVILGGPDVAQVIGNAARSDQSPLLRAYAAAAMWRLGDVYGEQILLGMYQDNDWFVRALATRYLGDLGGSYEYQKLFQQLGLEQNASVKAELCSALLHLQKFKDR